MLAHAHARAHTHTRCALTLLCVSAPERKQLGGATKNQLIASCYTNICAHLHTQTTTNSATFH